MSDEWFKEYNYLNPSYKKRAGIITLILMMIAGVLLGGYVSYDMLTKEGCNANPSIWLTFGSGLMAIAGFIGGLLVMGMVGFIGLLTLPDTIKKKLERRKYRTPKVVPIKEQLSNIWSWLVERKTGILIILGAILALLASSYLLGYTAWLIVC